MARLGITASLRRVEGCLSKGHAAWPVLPADNSNHRAEWADDRCRLHLQEGQVGTDNVHNREADRQMNEVNEHDVVRVNEPVEGYVIGEQRTIIIPAGSEGTVVDIGGPSDRPEAYEVEFNIEPFPSSALATVSPAAVTVVWRVSGRGTT